MARPPRISVGGVAYHVLNRANGRVQIFQNDADYAAFEKVLAEAVSRFEMRLCAYCVMPNHWHMIVWPQENGQLSEFAGWISLTHTTRWHAAHGTSGCGHIYQGRFKSFPIDTDEYFLIATRYVEGNAYRANLVDRAEAWPWSSLWRRVCGTHEQQLLLAEWPVQIPANWLALVNEPLPRAQIDAIRQCATRGRPFGAPAWQQAIADRLGLRSTPSPRGRPRKRGLTPFSQMGSDPFFRDAEGSPAPR